MNETLVEWGRRNLTGTLDAEVREAMTRKPQCWFGKLLGQCPHNGFPNTQRSYT